MMENKQKAQITPEIMAAQWSLLYRQNEDFRADFDKDPKAAISWLLGQEFPSDVEVVVHRSKSGQVHVVVPDEIPGMTDEQLEGISGGYSQAVAQWLDRISNSRGGPYWGATPPPDAHTAQLRPYTPRRDGNGNVIPFGVGERP